MHRHAREGEGTPLVLISTCCILFLRIFTRIFLQSITLAQLVCNSGLFGSHILAKLTRGAWARCAKRHGTWQPGSAPSALNTHGRTKAASFCKVQGSFSKVPGSFSKVLGCFSNVSEVFFDCAARRHRSQ